jgi:hypothetical protein
MRFRVTESDIQLSFVMVKERAAAVNEFLGRFRWLIRHYLADVSPSCVRGCSPFGANSTAMWRQDFGCKARLAHPMANWTCNDTVGGV